MSTETQEGVAAPGADKAPPSLPPLPAETPTGDAPPITFAGDRFVLVAREGGASTEVLDMETHARFRVAGRVALGEPEHAIHAWELGGVAVPPLRRARTWGTHVVVADEGEVRVVDLGDGGAILARAHGSAATARYDLDVGVLVTQDASSVEITRTRDGQRVVLPALDAETFIGIAGRVVYWADARGLVVVEVSSLTSRVVAAGERVTKVAVAKDAPVLALEKTLGAGDVTLEIAPLSGPVRPLSLRTASVESLAVSDDGAYVGWSEEVAEDGRVRFHVVDTRTSAHVRFSGAVECMLAPEALVSVEGGVVTTDGSCSIGCPSVRWPEVTLRYDGRSGRKLDERVVTPSQSYNERMVEEREAWEGAARRAGVAIDDLAFLSGERAVHATPAGLSIVTPSRAHPLPESRGLAPSELSISAGGGLVAATVDARVRVWSGVTGALLW